MDGGIANATVASNSILGILGTVAIRQNTGLSVAIVKQAGTRLFEEVPELIRLGGNAYTTRRYPACLRDMDYYLRAAFKL